MSSVAVLQNDLQDNLRNARSNDVAFEIIVVDDVISTDR
jgi:hypothetical protein